MGWQLRGYRMLSHGIALAGPPLLRRRLARGKEDPDRWREKLGEPGLPRPEGPLVWLHAVGLGEVLALRGLIRAMGEARPALSFLVTSSARSSAEGFAKTSPARTQHQFLPLDAPPYVRRFLNHWQPDLSIWAEQDLWPNAVVMAAEAEVPLAMVNARMGQAAFARRQRMAGLYGDVLRRFSMISAQDEVSRGHLQALGASAVSTDGPLKAAAEPLPVDQALLARLRQDVGRRKVWLVASSHRADEDVAASAMDATPGLWIIAPRDIARGAEVAARFAALGKRVARHSRGEDIAGCDVYVADSFGEMGVWYALADAALIGGTFDATEGHSPWEAAALGCAVLHGPRVGNFQHDYRMLRGVVEVTAETFPGALQADHRVAVTSAQAVVDESRAGLAPLARRLCDMVRV